MTDTCKMRELLSHGICCLFLFAFLEIRVGLGQQEVEGVRAKEFSLQPSLEYYLIAADRKLPTPERGYKLLIVMPGGDGSADFLPFVQNIYKNVRSTKSISWSN